MASSSTAKGSSASSSSSFDSSGIQWEYEVFLSFRGEDTRNNFTDHLYAALNDRGIYTFRDVERLERGKEISSELLEAIKRSRFSIIVLSKNYASSTWCLEELAKILECMDTKKQKVFPVFYKVDPSDIRKQRGDFETAFHKHEEDCKDNLVALFRCFWFGFCFSALALYFEWSLFVDFGSLFFVLGCCFFLFFFGLAIKSLFQKKKKVQRWRSALTQVGNLSGWHLQESRSEAESIKLIVNTISMSLKPTFSKVAEDLVGIKYSLEKINDLLVSGLDDIRFIGIYGMGGIGKTTIARVLCDSFSGYYQGSCFLANVREVSGQKGVVHLQEKLLSDVLKETSLNISHPDEGINYIRRRLCHKRVFVVLDDVDDQLKQLQKLAGEDNWFGSGSRIIVTTRDKHVLISHKIFNSIYEVKGLEDDDALQLFHKIAFTEERKPTDDYVELSKKIVQYTNGLPLALEVLGSHLCGRTVKEWESELNILRHVPHKEILKILRISYDGLDETQKQIFLEIACFFKGKNKDRVMEILDSCYFYSSAIGIKVLDDKSLITISNNELVGMHDLLQQMGWEMVREKHRDDCGQWSRLWLFEDIYQVLTENRGTQEVKGIMLDKSEHRITHLNGRSFSNMRNLRLLKIRNVDLSEDIEYLSNELRFLKWPEYPLNSLPSNFQSRKLFEINLCRSRIEYLWKDKKDFQNLKTIKLNYSHNLIETPDFTKVPKLEMLDLEDCTRLCKVHESVGGLKRLTILNLKGCSKLDKLPQNLGEMECLEELDLGGTAITQVPESIRKLSKLKILYLENCRWLQSLPELPPNTIFVGADNCHSLEDVSGALRGGASKYFALHLMGCLKLLENEVQENSLVVILLKQYLKQWVNHFSRRFHIRLPGNEIPKWFSCRSDGDSVVIKLRPNWLNDEFMGIAICGVYAPDPEDLNNGIKQMSFGMSIMGFNYSIIIDIPSFIAGESDHLWLTFVSRVMFEYDYSYKITEDDTSRPSSDDVSVSGSTYIFAWFKIDGAKKSKSKVIKCGIRLVYKQDLEDFQELPAAEGSTFHQNHNCSPAEDFSGCSSQFSASAFSSSSDSSGIQCEDEEILSFRGEHNRNNFTHLYTALNDSRIDTYFRDDERLERSSVSIIVLSKNYAASTWCLEELAKILECMDTKKQKVFPVFYKVNPSDIRNQRGDFETAFKVQRWRSALTEVGNLSGWHLQEGTQATKSSMASSSTAKGSSASSSSSSFDSSGIRWKYEVFLSFRGEDTRYTFTDHLYTALKGRGIYTFRDDERLERGKEISSKLLEAIERSRFSIIVLSKNYASSTWCLEELAKILECMASRKQKVFPVFYNVDPSDIRKQRRDFETAFHKHEEDYKDNLDKVQRWRSALTRVGNLSGWHLQESRSETESIKLIVDTISMSLKPTFSKVAEDLVGIKYSLKKINDLLVSGLDDIRFIGICGMGGIGKTTIARVLYEHFSDDYQGSCFLADVREVSSKKGVVHLQEMLLSDVLNEKLKGDVDIRRRLCHKKVFVVLDDVDHLEQLEKLAGKHNWFGSGSRIIITTRNMHVLISHGINSIYEVKGLEDDDALQLFHMKAFRQGQPTDDHVELSKQIVRYTNGLPLALEVLGSHLCGRTVKEWKSERNRLQHVPRKEILKILQISYDGLEEDEKQIFLDIACFFKGKNKDRVEEILDGCDFDSAIGILKRLEYKALITISDDNKLGMHDLLREIGWEIVCEKHRDDCGNGVDYGFLRISIVLRKES